MLFRSVPSPTPSSLMLPELLKVSKVLGANVLTVGREYKLLAPHSIIQKVYPFYNAEINWRKWSVTHQETVFVFQEKRTGVSAYAQ